MRASGGGGGGRSTGAQARCGCPRPGERGRMSGKDGNEEFYRQLQLQQQYEAKPGEGESESDPFTYVDPADGAAYEWDLEKKAWFPKVGTGEPRGRGRRRCS